MASNKLQVSDFDFDDIKANLKSFLQDQSEFQDYDFEGSGFAVLLDLLAYNTHYLGFNANMLANEMYLDSADIRKNIVSLAKMLGYTPTSPKSPSATIDILMNNIHLKKYNLFFYFNSLHLLMWCPKSSSPNQWCSVNSRLCQNSYS